MEEVCSPRSGRWLCICSGCYCCLRHSDSPTAEPLNLFRPKSNHYGLNHMKRANTYEVCAGWMGCATLSLANDIDALKVLPGAPRMRRTSESNRLKKPHAKRITKGRQRQMNPSHNCVSLLDLMGTAPPQTMCKSLRYQIKSHDTGKGFASLIHHHRQLSNSYKK